MKMVATPSTLSELSRKFSINLKVLKDGEMQSYTNQQTGAQDEFMTVSTIGTDGVRQDVVLYGEAFLKNRGGMNRGAQLGLLSVFV